MKTCKTLYEDKYKVNTGTACKILSCTAGQLEHMEKKGTVRPHPDSTPRKKYYYKAEIVKLAEATLIQPPKCDVKESSKPNPLPEPTARDYSDFFMNEDFEFDHFDAAIIKAIAEMIKVDDFYSETDPTKSSSAEASWKAMLTEYLKATHESRSMKFASYWLKKGAN